MTTLNEALAKVDLIAETVDEMINFARNKGLGRIEALSLFGACVTSIIQGGAPSHGQALSAAASFTSALWQSLGVDLDFTVAEVLQAAEAKVDASKLN